MRLRLGLFILFVSLLTGADACTIGVADGSVTASGRPLLWKTRDSAGMNNGLRYIDTQGARYVAMMDPGDDSVWMGVNEHGLGILNSYSADLGNRFGNGELMRMAMATCADIDDFQALLDSTNITGRLTLGNIGVIDAHGGASIFEVGMNTYTRFDAADEDGYIVRANFSVTGGGSTGIARYNRAHNIVQWLIATDDLRHDTLARTFLRDLSDGSSSPFSLPYMLQWAPGRPYGYIDADWSICSNTTVSAAVIEGVLPGEPAWLSTLWSMPGNPFSTVILPAWPVCEPPSAARTDNVFPSSLTTLSLDVRRRLFDYPFGATWLDTWKLADDEGGGWLTELEGLENGLLLAADVALTTWRVNPPDSLMMYEAADSLANIALSWLHNNTPPTARVADFATSVTSGVAPLTVQFTDQSLHRPTEWSWDFTGDGQPESIVMNPSYTFTQPGVYSVTLVINSGEDGVTVDSLITVLPVAQPTPAWMHPAAPNPFTRQAVVEFSIPRDGHVLMQVFNIRGQLMATLYDEEMSEGEHVAVWSPRLMHKKRIAAGVYIVRIKAPDLDEAQKMVYLPE